MKPGRRLYRGLSLLLLVTLGACGRSSPPGAPGGTDGGDSNKAEVRRTEYGLVHIKADSYQGLGYGYGHAFAEDNLCVIADSYVTVSGERSKYFGPDASWEFTGNGTTNNNLNSDFFFKLLIAEQRVEKLLALAPPRGPRPEVRALVRGYVAGYNRYLRETGIANLPDPSCRGAPWVREITEIDVYRRFYQLALLASSGVAIDGIGGAQPPTLGLIPQVPALPSTEQLRELGKAYQGIQIGSNAIALGKAATSNGRGMLLGNPHFPWDGSERFHQVHFTIPGVVDVTGVSLFGVPLVVIGHTRNLAWSHTVSSAWRFTPYQLTLVPGQPTSYLVDGAAEAMTPYPLSVESLQADGSLGTVDRTLYTTRWGPVFTSVLGLPLFPWLPVQAYAMADANAENFRYVNHFLEVDRAQSTEELLEVLKRNQGIPWVNTLAADSAGKAFYADISVTPNVPDAKALSCAGVLGLVTQPLLGLPVLDGSRSACAWDVDEDAVQPGTIGPARMPHLFRDDYVTNSNDSYWLSNPAEPLEGYARIIGDERSERRMRTRLGLVMVEERLAGSDGLAGNTFSRQQLQDLLYSDRQHAADLWLDSFLPFCQLTPVMLGAGGPVLTSEACAVLAAWDRTSRRDSPGAALWERFIANLYGPAIPSGSAADYGAFASVWTQPFDVNDPVHTPSGINLLNPLVQAAFAAAITDLQGAGLALDASMGQAQVEMRGTEAIPIHGAFGDYGSFNDIKSVWDAVHGYNDVVHGSSFIEVVSFDGDDCPDTQTILTYSQSANPASPHYADQTWLYSQGGWAPARYCESEIAGHLSSTRTLAE